ncbi:MaoC family dehydratase [Candidatus Formimonas warabiya]|uniref:MaoC-like domain-containing protein n=1 Tax=Formimonas warabiya TaxID=1761012 RepID=A0A3G1KXM9_FORW1|nr:MaoC family dehydratase [Candidatus Formimonas warabiya]ATW26965.1 hypothetical protein DCMF_21335 [Candidatus Formimonas warabiya]
MSVMIKTGDTFSLEKTISPEMVKDFADFSGDYNPVHMDEMYCLEHGLGSRVVHGMLILSFLSTLIGMHLPGPGALWLSQSIDFISPVRIGDRIKITGKVTDQVQTNALGLNIIVMKIEITNQLGQKVSRGTVKVSVK